MKRSAKPLCPQMNLPLGNAPPAGNPEDQREDLTVALMELLIGAAESKHEQPENGGEMNPKLTPERLVRKAIIYGSPVQAKSINPQPGKHTPAT